MEEITGSLNYFIKDFPNQRRYLQILETSKRPTLLSPMVTPKRLRYPKSTEHKSKKFSFESKSLVFKKINPSILSSIESKSIRKISPQDQLQGELMMGRKHELLRSMRENLKNEERKNIDNSVESQGVEKVFKILQNPGKQSNQSPIEFQRKLIVSFKKANYRKLLDERYSWIVKRNAISINLQTKEGLLTLQNKSSSIIAFKVQTSSPKVFSVNPTSGRLQGNSSIIIKISANLNEEVISKSHKFLIKVKESAEANVDWKTSDVKDYKIPVVLVANTQETNEEVKLEKVEIAENPNRFKTDLFKSGIVKNFLTTENKDMENNRKTFVESRIRDSEVITDKSGKGASARYQELVASVDSLKAELEKARNKEKFAIELGQVTSVSVGKYSVLHVVGAFVLAFLLGLYLS